jgi:hypothetical protein
MLSHAVLCYAMLCYAVQCSITLEQERCADPWPEKSCDSQTDLENKLSLLHAMPPTELCHVLCALSC